VIAEVLKVGARKLRVFALEFLKGHDVGPGQFEPPANHGEASPEGVDIEGGDLHGRAFRIAAKRKRVVDEPDAMWPDDEFSLAVSI
jgi:hypothetical protein